MWKPENNINIFELLSIPEPFINGILMKKKDWFSRNISSYAEKPNRVDYKYLYKTGKTTYSCKYCGVGDHYVPKNRKWFLLVDKNWRVLFTFCSDCSGSNVGIDDHKRDMLQKIAPKGAEAKKYFIPRDTQLSIIQWNKYTKRTLKSIWRKSKTREFFDDKPFLIDKGLRYYYKPTQLVKDV